MTVQEKKEYNAHTAGIEVGTHASGTYWSDYTPFEVVKVSPSGKTVTIRELDATTMEGSDPLGDQLYAYTPNPEGVVKTVRLTKRGWRTPDDMRITFGYARKYRDPHF